MQRAQGFAQQGDQLVITAGKESSNSVQASYPGATVTVFYTGTTTLATIYADNLSPATPLGNPFTTNDNGYWFFYAPNGRYDVALAGGGMSEPWTIGDLLLDDQSSLGITIKGSVPTAGDLPTVGNQPGDAYVALDTGHLWMWDGTAWVDLGDVQGPQGPPGATGPTGPEGPTGPAGATGATGPAGPTGSAGAQGPPGATGPTGQQGIPGTPGAAGATGPTGPQGPPGPQGIPGSAVAIKGSVPTSASLPTSGNTLNDAWIVEDTGHLWVWNGTTWVDAGKIVGPQGPQGPVGAQGPTGPPGPTGPTGPTGPLGATGPAGPQGPVGPGGAMGPAGPSGPVGPSGSTGPTGPAGPAGSTGATGGTGPSGPEGPAGPAGVPGPMGPAGPPGPTGAPGPVGIPIYVDGVLIGYAGSGIAPVIGFTISNGLPGTNVGPMLPAPRVGSVTQCVVVTKASDGGTALQFTIKRNGTSIFTSAPTIAAGTAAGTLSTFTSLTSSPLTVAVNDIFTIDILSGSSSWVFTAQLES